MMKTKGFTKFLLFGNPAIPEGPVAFRPAIARGLAFWFIYQNASHCNINSRSRLAHLTPCLRRALLEYR